jgi:hypothetical protein
MSQCERLKYESFSLSLVIAFNKFGLKREVVMKRVVLISAFLIASCKSNPSGPIVPTLTGNWSWYCVSLPNTAWPDSFSNGSIHLDSKNGKVNGKQAFPDGSFVVITGTDSYPNAILNFDFGHRANWKSECRYVTSDSVFGIEHGNHGESLQYDILVRTNGNVH